MEPLQWPDLLAQSADAIWALDEDDRIIAWNRAAEEMFDYRREEIIGEPLSRLIPEDLIEAREPERLRKALEELGAVRDYETRRVTKGGRELEVSLTRTVHRGGQGGPGRPGGPGGSGGPDAGMVSATIVRDLTQRRAIERQMIEVERLAALGELAGSVAQEIGAPLTTIGLLVDGLRRSCVTLGDNSKKQLDTIDQALERIGRLTRGLVELARPGELHMQPLNVNDVIAGALELAEPSMRRAGIEIELKTNETLPEIRGDSGQLQQVFLHLLMNAQRALETGENPRVNVSARLERGFPAEGRPLRGAIAIEFRDNGPGIDPADTPFIFTPFFSRSGGSGLGLPLAKQVVVAHGGTLDVESTPGAGTTVIIQLPVDSDE
ncbi:MAG: ATP-binding protein [Gemmatimonadota bacterium]